MMEVEKRIETFGVQVDDLPDELKGRRISGGSGDSGVHGVILEEDEDSRDGDNGSQETSAEGDAQGASRVIKRVSQITFCQCQCLHLYWSP